MLLNRQYRILLLILVFATRFLTAAVGNSYTITLEEKLLASDGAALDYFGYSVDISGDTAVIGAPEDDDTGSAYVFVRNETSWVQQAKLIADDIEFGDRFGDSVSISGHRILIGAPHDDDQGTNSGSAYIFVRNGTTWRQQAKLNPISGATNHWFGNTVDISEETAVIGMFDPSGSVHVFEFTHNAWIEQAKLISDSVNDYFGAKVSINGDIIAVSASHANTQTNRAGKVYIFMRHESTWTKQTALLANDGQSDDRFGSSIDVSGNTVAVGAHWDDGDKLNSGSAYIFERNGNTWTQQAKIIASDNDSNDYFGSSISISGDAIIVGAYGDVEAGGIIGSAYIFQHNGNTWTQKVKLLPSNRVSSQQSGYAENFGHTVSISGDHAIVGAYGNNFTANDSGSACIYDIAVAPFTVTFDLANKGFRTGAGTLTQIISAGTSAKAPTVKAKPGWHFTGWNTAFDVITSNLTIIAQYTPNYTITFAPGEHGKLVSGDLVQTVEAGLAATAPIITANTGWYFTGWDSTFSAVDKDLTVTAQFVPTYTVTFVLGEAGSLASGELIQSVGEGYSAIAPELSVTTGNIFIGWDRRYNNITENITVNAQYTSDTLAGVLETRWVPNNGYKKNYFGYEVSINGDTALVSDASDVRVLVRTNNSWVQEAKLSTSDYTTGLGYAVAVSGNTAVLGAFDDNQQGSVYVFVRTGNTWNQQAKIIANDGMTDDYFGIDVSIDGNTILVGAAGDDDNGSNSGSIYIYVRNGNIWNLESKLIAEDGMVDNYFGNSTSISGDTALISAHGDDAQGSNSGSAYVYVRTGNTWTLQTKLMASDGAANYFFGYDVAISGDTAIIGTDMQTFDLFNPNPSNPGCAYVFTRNENTWNSGEKLTASDSISGDGFGNTVSISGDIALVGSPYHTHDSSDSGSAYVFVRNGTNWHKQAKLFANNSAAGDLMSYSLGISGNTALIGAVDDDNDNGIDSGSVYFYDLGVSPLASTFDWDKRRMLTGSSELFQLVRLGNTKQTSIIEAELAWLFDSWSDSFLEITHGTNIIALYAKDIAD